MSNIIQKAFNASLRVIRSVFRGSPNLITSADLNRQFEALKFQLDQLDDKTGVFSDFSLDASLEDGTMTATYRYSFVQFKGCSFTPKVSPISIGITKDNPTVYVCLVADTELVTYESDASHEISGAKFADGTSQPAADNWVYRNEQVVALHSTEGVENLVGILAVVKLSDSEKSLIIKNNCLGRSTSLRMGYDGVLQNYSESNFGKIADGDSYDEAFSKLGTQVNRRSMIIDVTSTQSNDYRFELQTAKEIAVEEGDVIEFHAVFSFGGSQQSITKSLKVTAMGEIYASNDGITPILKTSIESSPEVYPLGYSVSIVTIDSGLFATLTLTASEGNPLTYRGSGYCILHKVNKVI